MPKPASFVKVCDRFGSPIRGLWIRKGKFYGQISLIDPATGQRRVQRIPLPLAGSTPQAVGELNRLRQARQEGKLGATRRAPALAEAAQLYLDHAGLSKRASTWKTERVCLRRWLRILGARAMSQITAAVISAGLDRMRQEGAGARTANIYLTALRNFLEWSRGQGWLNRSPAADVAPFRHTAKARDLLTRGEIDAFCAASVQHARNGQGLADYVRLMACCGSRRNETLRLRWQDVDFERRQLRIGWDGQTKSGRARYVEFNPPLEALLRDMSDRRHPKCDWLFPSFASLKRPAKSMVEAFRKVRRVAGLVRFTGFHLLRHYFASHAVMSGIDCMTVASWLGHSDGGMLVSKVYGHLNREHAQRQAAKLSFD